MIWHHILFVAMIITMVHGAVSEGYDEINHIVIKVLACLAWLWLVVALVTHFI